MAFYGNYAEFATAQANVENAVIANSADRVVMVIASNACTEDLTDAVNDVAQEQQRLSWLRRLGGIGPFSKEEHLGFQHHHFSVPVSPHHIGALLPCSRPNLEIYSVICVQSGVLLLGRSKALAGHAGLDPHQLPVRPGHGKHAPRTNPPPARLLLLSSGGAAWPRRSILSIRTLSSRSHECLFGTELRDLPRFQGHQHPAAGHQLLHLPDPVLLHRCPTAGPCEEPSTTSLISVPMWSCSRSSSQAPSSNTAMSPSQLHVYKHRYSLQQIEDGHDPVHLRFRRRKSCWRMLWASVWTDIIGVAATAPLPMWVWATPPPRWSGWASSPIPCNCILIFPAIP